jgi:hypothetical protein
MLLIKRAGRHILRSILQALMMVKKKKTVGYLMEGYLISKKHYYSLEVELIYQYMLNAQVNHSTFHL